mgnify:CR=1 FL=1
MAIVKELVEIQLEKDSKHSVAECTYSIITDLDGNTFLQIKKVISDL